MKIYFDGSCKGQMPSKAKKRNLGEIELLEIYSRIRMYCSIVAVDENLGEAKVARVTISNRQVGYLPSSVVAEWYGLFYAMRYARACEAKEVTIIGDSLSVIEHLVDHTLKSKVLMKDMSDIFYRLLDTMGIVNLEHTNRLQNYAGLYSPIEQNQHLKFLLQENYGISKINILPNTFWSQDINTGVQRPEQLDSLQFLVPSPTLSRDRTFHEQNTILRRKTRQEQKNLQEQEDSLFFQSAFGLK